MENDQLTVLTTGLLVVLAGLAPATPAPERVKLLATLARAASSADETEAPEDAVADTNARVTTEVLVRSRSMKVNEPLSRSC